MAWESGGFRACCFISCCSEFHMAHMVRTSRLCQAGHRVACGILNSLLGLYPTQKDLIVSSAVRNPHGVNTVQREVCSGVPWASVKNGWSEVFGSRRLYGAVLEQAGSSLMRVFPGRLLSSFQINDFYVLLSILELHSQCLSSLHPPLKLIRNNKSRSLLWSSTRQISTCCPSGSCKPA